MRKNVLRTCKTHKEYYIDAGMMALSPCSLTLSFSFAPLYYLTLFSFILFFILSTCVVFYSLLLSLLSVLILLYILSALCVFCYSSLFSLLTNCILYIVVVYGSSRDKFDRYILTLFDLSLLPSFIVPYLISYSLLRFFQG
jgi:hypothetical protein